VHPDAARLVPRFLLVAEGGKEPLFLSPVSRYWRWAFSRSGAAFSKTRLLVMKPMA